MQPEARNSPWIGLVTAMSPTGEPTPHREDFSLLSFLKPNVVTIPGTQTVDLRDAARSLANNL